MALLACGGEGKTSDTRIAGRIAMGGPVVDCFAQACRTLIGVLLCVGSAWLCFVLGCTVSCSHAPFGPTSLTCTTHRHVQFYLVIGAAG